MTERVLWFKARRYGWGWGPATTWQGWLVYGVYAALAALSAVLLPPPTHGPAFVATLAVLTAVLIGVCATQGERPGWRWGGH
jgi:hypothetical protein